MPPNVADTTVPVTNAAPSTSGQEENRRSRKPANTKFKQQQLPAWQPMLTARSVLPFLVAIGVAFIPIGIALFLSARNVVEKEIEYTHCKQVTTYDGRNQEEETCANITLNSKQPCKCQLNLGIENDIAGPVFLYYGLDNFFQNHRKYVKSRDDLQLMGEFIQPNPTTQTGPSTDCNPFATVNGNSSWGYAPCGAIANSLFNDTINMTYTGKTGQQSERISLLRTGIAWKSDKDVKFRNPPFVNSTEKLKEVCNAKNLRKPAYWEKELWELDEDINNNGLKNEDLIVWMRTAAFPSFRKLYRRVNHTANTIFADGLPAGNYTFDIDYRFPVTKFDGRKYVIISSVSWIGGRNPFLGIAYMTVGSVCLLLAAVFFFIHIKWGKSFEAHAQSRFDSNTPFAHRRISQVLRVDTRSTTPDSRSFLSSDCWTDIPSSSPRTEDSADSRNTTTPDSSQGKKRSVHFGQDSAHSTGELVHVQVVSALGGLRTGQTIHELVNDILAKVTVLNPEESLDLANRRSSPRKSILRPEDPKDLDVRMRRRQMMDQPMLVD